MVLPGWDMFATLSQTRIGVDLDGPAGAAGPMLMQFASEPLGTFDFGVGPRDVGGADTIVHRLGTATPEHGEVAVELVALQMRSIAPPGYFVTLQSDRGRHPLDPPDGPASTGTLDIAFNQQNTGGTFHSEFLVVYDVRHGTTTGPIVATGVTPISGDDPWSHAPPDTARATCHTFPIDAHCVIATVQDIAVWRASLIPEGPGRLKGLGSARRSDREGSTASSPRRCQACGPAVMPGKGGNRLPCMASGPSRAGASGGCQDPRLLLAAEAQVEQPAEARHESLIYGQ